MHVGPQLMPVVAPSALVTVPVPPLAADFESVAIAEGGLKVTVTLTGAVDNQVERMLAFSLAQVPGVFSVKNNLVVDKS